MTTYFESLLVSLETSNLSEEEGNDLALFLVEGLSNFVGVPLTLLEVSIFDESCFWFNFRYLKEEPQPLLTNEFYGVMSGDLREDEAFDALVFPFCLGKRMIANSLGESVIRIFYLRDKLRSSWYWSTKDSDRAGWLIDDGLEYQYINENYFEQAKGLLPKKPQE